MAGVKNIESTDGKKMSEQIEKNKICMKDAIKEFEKYTSNFDTENKKIQLKIEHTYHVMEMN